MFRQNRILYISIIVLVLAAAGLAVVDLAPGIAVASRNESAKTPEGRTEEHEAVTLSADEARRAGIKVERIEPAEYAGIVAAVGTVGPDRNSFARVSAPVAGQLVKVAVDLGAQVKAGTMLAMLESPELAEVRTAYRQNQTELDLAKLNLERAQKLSTDRSIAQKDLLRAQSDYERARADLSASEAKLSTLGVPAVPDGGASPALLAVNAPLSGTVVERTAVLGEYAQAYQALFSVADLSTVWVETNLYDRDLGAVAIGASAIVTVTAFPGQRFPGKVTYVGNLLDKDTRTAIARVEVANPDGRLRPGLFANVDIETASRHSALRVPETAVVLLQGQMTAFVAHDDGFASRPVELGERQGGMVVVTSGLEPGDQVVVAGVYALKARLLKSQIGDSH
jgi:cobalt-zinc-cadmium efflux system membrane fusion protein